ncbi:MAG: orotate phosphoribosyltransferase [Conexivisphaera sp.]|nr:orotate phosphoribosyltransferase (PyrE) [uncultured archaeon]
MSRIASILRRRGVVRRGSYLLHLGNSSEYYVDMRTLPSYPDDFDEVTSALADLLSGGVGQFDRLVGVGDGASPFTVAVSLKLQKPYAIVKKMEAENSFRDPLLGELRAGERAILVDDVASTGITLACATSIVRALGARVDTAVVLVDRELGASSLLSTFGVRLMSVLKLGDILGDGGGRAP